MASEPISTHLESATAVDLDAALRAIQDEQAAKAEKITKPLVGFPHLKVLMVSLPAGGAWEQHSTPGRISVQTLTGRIRMKAMGQTFDLPPGRLLALESNVPHDVDAPEASVFLLTVARS